MAKKILFLGHDATRTGAPLLLLELVKWLKNNSDIDPYFVLLNGGELEGEYLSLGPLEIISANKQDSKYKVLLQEIGLLKKRNVKLSEKYLVGDFPLVYANTIVTLGCVNELICKGRKIIHHIHELELISESFHSVENFKRVSIETNLYIAASKAVNNYLINEIKIPKEKTVVVHEFPISVNTSIIKYKNSIRDKLNIPQDAFLVGMCGWPQWRKGTDLFVQTAKEVIQKKMKKNIFFVWLGGSKESHKNYTNDIKKVNLEENCFFEEQIEDTNDFYNDLDLYCLTSREDPFSVAMLEAGMRSVPIVCFENSGGATELINDEAGIAVPYLDTEAMGEAICYYNDNRTIAKLHGNKIKNRIIENYTLEKKCREISSIIESLYFVER